jgi:flagellar hook protein FlgE
MSFYTSLSGLQAAQSDMSTISHNLANVSTNGFKKSSSEFADVIASNFSTDPRRMTGSGVALKQNVQDFAEGSLQTTSSSLDLAISGDGFFAVKTAGNNGALQYTRNGSFLVDANNYIVDAQGSDLQAYPVDASGNVTASGSDGLTNVQIPETSGTPSATSKISLAVNLGSGTGAPATTPFDRTDSSSYNNSTATTIYDADGNAQTLTNYYVRNPAGDGTDGSTAWTVYSYVGDQALTSGGAAGVPMTFDASGNMTAPAAALAFDTFTPPSTGTPQSMSLDLSGSTQKAATFAVAARSQDGVSVGQLSGISIDDSGLITASFSNGDTKMLGKVALANFSNPTGLRQMGNSYWAATGISGSPSLGAASENGFGSLMSGTIEGSNVDITEELVNLIAAQRNFQANAKALDTQGQISDTIFNMRS